MRKKYLLKQVWIEVQKGNLYYSGKGDFSENSLHSFEAIILSNSILRKIMQKYFIFPCFSSLNFLSFKIFD